MSGLSTTRNGFVLGSVCLSVFEANHVLKGGLRDLQVWPFQAFDPLMICQKECNTYERSLIEGGLVQPLTISIKFPEREKPLIWAMPINSGNDQLMVSSSLRPPSVTKDPPPLV